MEEISKMIGRKTDTNFKTGTGKNFYNQPNSGIQYYDSNNVIKDEEDHQGTPEASFFEPRKSPFVKNASMDSMLNSNNSSSVGLQRGGTFIPPYQPRAPPPKSMREVQVLNTLKASISRSMMEKMTFE